MGVLLRRVITSKRESRSHEYRGSGFKSRGMAGILPLPALAHELVRGVATSLSLLAVAPGCPACNCQPSLHCPSCPSCSCAGGQPVVQSSGFHVGFVVAVGVLACLAGILIGCLAGWRAHAWAGLLGARPAPSASPSASTSQVLEGSSRGKGKRGIWIHEQLAVQG